MKLKSIYISEYKNLKEFTFNFLEDSFIEIFVGKNGSGKSNFFEAIIEIFRHLFEFKNSGIDLFYDYTLNYSIEKKDIEVKYISGELSINGKNSKSVSSELLPDNIVVYYTGHNPKVKSLLNQYINNFSNKIKDSEFDETRRFIGIGPEYKELFLTMMLLLPEDNEIRDFLIEKLGINSIGQEIRIVLKRPIYAAGNTSFDVISADDEGSRYWKAKGITKTFLDRLSKCVSYSSGEIVRAEGYIANDDQYIHYFDIEKIKKEFSDFSHQQLFRQFDNLKSLQMLKDIKIFIQTTGSTDLSISDFSDGQFQEIYLYAILELFKDKNCITLLDEPDSFLHPEWQYDSLKDIHKILSGENVNNHILLTSHSAVTLLPTKNSKVSYFDLNKKSESHCYRVPKRFAINKLSNDLIKYTEKDQILSILNTIQIENKPVLFTEGHTDPIILKEAWNRLYDVDMPFIPFYAFSCGYIKQLLTDSRIHNEMNGLPIFGLFDLDKAYDQWNDLNGTVIQDDYFKGMVKKWEHNQAFAIILPLIENDVIKKQVIKNEDKNETFGSDSHYEIEHIFYGSEVAKSYFIKEPCAGGEIISFVSDKQKTKFAQEIVPTIENEYFKTFKPMFDFIESTIHEVEKNQ